MDFRLSPEQQQFRDSVRGFADKHLKAGALQRAHQAEHPFDVAKLMAEQGLDRKSTRLNSSHVSESRMPSSA